MKYALPANNRIPLIGLLAYCVCLDYISSKFFFNTRHCEPQAKQSLRSADCFGQSFPRNDDWSILPSQ